MKKLISVLLSVLIILSCIAVTVYAGENSGVHDNVNVDFSDVSNTEITVAEPATQPVDTIKESFKAYLEETYGKGEEFEYRNFGTVDGYAVVYGYNHTDPIEGTTTEIGDYCLTTPATQSESAGLYLYKDGKFNPFNDKTEFLKDNNELVRKIVDLLTDSFGEGLSVGHVICRYPTEPINETEPVTESQPGGDIAPPQVNYEEIDYLAMMKKAGIDVDSAKFIGVIGEPGYTVNVLVYAYKGEIIETTEDIAIGDYIFSTAHHSPDTLGLYVANFNYYRGWSESVMSLADRVHNWADVNMNDVYNTIKNSDVKNPDFVIRHRDGDEGLKCYDAIKNSFGDHDYSKILGKVDGCYVVYAGRYMVSPAGYVETLGKYNFVNHNYVARCPLGLYIVKDDTAYSLKDAYDKGVIKNESIGDVARLVGEYVQVVICENSEYRDFSFSCADAVWGTFGVHDYYNIIGKTGESYIVYAGNYEVREANYIETLYGSLSGYEFENPNQVGRYELGLYIVNKNKAYTLKDAYDKKIISFEELKTVADAILKAKVEIKVTSFIVEPTEPYTGWDDNTAPTVTIPATEPSSPYCIMPTKPVKNDITEENLKANPVKVRAKTKTVKAEKLKKASQTVKLLTVKNAKGKVKITKLKKGSSAAIYKKIKVKSKTGAATLLKGKYKRGTYKLRLKISVSGNKTYAGKTLRKTVKIKIK